MSQRDQDRVVIDLIEELLKPEAVPQYEVPAALEGLTSRHQQAFYAFITLAGLMVLLLSSLAGADDNPESNVPDGVQVVAYLTLFGGIVLLVLCYKFRQIVEKVRLDNVLYAQRTHELRLQQRTQILQHLASADVARAAARGQYSAQDLEYSWKRQEMEHVSEQAEKQRSHELDKIDRQIDGDIRKMEAEHEAARGARRQELEDTIDQLYSIKGIKNKTVRNQAYDAFRRGQK